MENKTLKNTMVMIYPYYNNPEMLKLQMRSWDKYEGELRNSVKLILIDDGSQESPAYDIFKECKIPKELYKIEENIPWNQHGARNLGAKVCSNVNDWMFMSDIDIVLPPEAAYSLLEKTLDPGKHYTFERVFAPDLTEYLNHCNTFLVKRDVYWAVGGYDEDYCGTYGGDYPFLNQMEAIAPEIHLDDILLLNYAPSVIKDANTRDWGRKDSDLFTAYTKMHDMKRATGNEKSINPLRFHWKRLL